MTQFICWLYSDVENLRVSSIDFVKIIELFSAAVDFSNRLTVSSRPYGYSRQLELHLISIYEFFILQINNFKYLNTSTSKMSKT